MFTSQTHKPAWPGGRSHVACQWREQRTVELWQQLFLQTQRMGGETGEERNGMHSWWICHFGLWPGSLPITFKLAAACKTLHISHGVPHALLGPSAPTTTLINQPLREKKRRRTGAPLSSYPSHSHSLWSLQTPRCMLTVPHAINMQQG